MNEWGGEENEPFTFYENLPPEKLFVSLVSICKDIPLNVKVIFHKHKYNLTNRIKYKEMTFKKIQQYREKKSQFVSIFENEYASLCSWIEKERHVRTYMKILVNKWLQKKYKNRILNVDDPCTLLPPLKPIKFFDHMSHGFYQFEASSLKKQFETALQYSEWLFPKPSHPKNPLTNIPFNEGQMITIVDCLRKYGYGSWFIEAYRSVGWNLTNFVADNATNLKINSITQLCKNPNAETYEFLDEFIVNQYDENELDQPLIKSVLRWAAKYKLDDDYMKLWLNLMKDYYIIKYRNNINDDDIDTDKLNIIYIRSMRLFDNTEKLNEYKTEAGNILFTLFDINISPIAGTTDEETGQSEEEESTDIALVEPTFLGNIVYIHTLNMTIEDLLNQEFQDEDL